MAQLDSAFTMRIPIAVDNTGASAVDKDVQVAIGSTFTEFWAAIDSDGHEIRITRADGVTELRWGRVSWDYANKEATLKILGDSGAGVKWTPPATGICLLWLYAGNDEIVSDAAEGTSPSSPLAGYLTTALPRRPVVLVEPHRPPQRTTPAHSISVHTTDERHLWFDVTEELARSAAAIEGGFDLEELQYVTLVGFNSVGGSTGVKTVTDTAKTRFRLWKGRLYVRVEVIAASLSDGDDLTLIAGFGLIDPEDETARAVSQRVAVYVRDPDDET